MRAVASIHSGREHRDRTGDERRTIFCVRRRPTELDGRWIDMNSCSCHITGSSISCRSPMRRARGR